MAKATNTIGVIYKKDIDYMREKNRRIVQRNLGYTFPIIKKN